MEDFEGWEPRGGGACVFHDIKKCTGFIFYFLKKSDHNNHCVGSLLRQDRFFDVVLVLND